MLDGGDRAVLVPCHFLNGGSQLAHRSAILFVGRSHVQSQQMDQRIDRQMHFSAFAPLGAIIALSMPTFRTRLQCATVKHGRRGLFSASVRQPRHSPRVVDDGFKHFRFEPNALVC